MRSAILTTVLLAAAAVAAPTGTLLQRSELGSRSLLGDIEKTADEMHARQPVGDFLHNFEVLAHGIVHGEGDHDGHGDYSDYDDDEDSQDVGASSLILMESIAYIARQAIDVLRKRESGSVQSDTSKLSIRKIRRGHERASKSSIDSPNTVVRRVLKPVQNVVESLENTPEDVAPVRCLVIVHSYSINH